MSELPPGGEPGRIVTVFAAKGGCGKTTLAINLAVVLRDGASRVCLLDLDLTFGDIAGSLRLEPRRTLGDLAGRGDGLDHATIQSATTSYLDGIDCLLAPTRPGEGRRVTPELIDGLLAELPRWYDYIVIDTPAQFSPHVLVAMDSAHHHVLLSTPDQPALKNLRRTLDLLDLLSYRRETRSIVLNRCDPGLSVADVESVVNGRIAAHLPSIADASVVMGRGQPIADAHPDHPISTAIRQFAGTHIVAIQPQENQQQ